MMVELLKTQTCPYFKNEVEDCRAVLAYRGTM